MSSQTITIRLSQPDDAAQVLRLKDDTWLDAYPSAEHGVTIADIRSHIAKDPAEDRIERWRGYLLPTDTMKNWVALADGEIVGFVAGATGDPRNEIKALYVLPTYQRQGIGTRLLAEAIGWLGSGKDSFLHVVAYNHPAIAAYSKAGFMPSDHSHDDEFALPSGAVMPEIEMVKKAGA